MRCNERGLALIRSFESCALKAYLCPAGKLTISYGVTGPQVRPGMVITQAQAEQMFADALRPREAALTMLLGDAPTTSDNFSAMLSLLYNIGAANFTGSTVLKRHKLGNIPGAANAFAMWNRATVNGVKTVLPGLTRRRAAEARLYRGEPA